MPVRAAWAALLLAVAALAPVPWWAGPAGLVLVAVGLPGLAAAMVLGAAPWPVGVGALGLAAVTRGVDRASPGARERVGFGLFVLGVGLVLGLKQVAVAQTLPAATTVLPALAAATVGAGAAVLGVDARSGPLLAAFAVCLRLGSVWAVDGALRLDRARALHAERLVYDGLLAEPELLPALVAAVPDRDEAALALGWEAALAAGWVPQHADGVEVPVARALEVAGRGGEALRLLRRHPRQGDVDAWLALFEVTQGETVRWKGAPLGPLVTDTLPLATTLLHNGYAEVLFTLPTTSTVHVDGTGRVWQGAPSVRIRLDAAPEARWTLDGAASVDLGAAEAGPHRVQVWFDTDLDGPGGDRQVVLTALRVSRG